MKLFVRGGMSLAALLFAAFLISYARPLLAGTTPSQTPPAQQQETQETPAQAARQEGLTNTATTEEVSQ